MKKGIFILMLMLSSITFAQSGLGVTGGVNYGDNGKLTYTDVTNAGDDVLEGGDRQIGYHLGLFYRKEFNGFFFRPELLYTRTTSSYVYNLENAEYKISKIDVPVLVGLEILGPVHVFAGPSIQYILNNDFEGAKIGDVQNEFTIGAQFGAGIQLGGLGLDVRYERGLKENEANFLDAQTGLRRIDSRPSQIIFSLSLIL